MSLDDKISRDPRITALANALGWTRRETLGCLVGEIWPLCYDLETPFLRSRDIDLAAGRIGFTECLIAADLATLTKAGIRIAGASSRIEYLHHARKSGKRGGINSGIARTSAEPFKGPGSNRQGSGNPPDPVPDLVPDPVTAPDNTEPPKAPLRKPRGKQLATPIELATVRVVLDRLGSHNGIRYAGSVAHTELIVSQLREGHTEDDLRSVVLYCAKGLGWRSDPKMAPYLRPETLFGAKTIARYLDAARAWFATLPDEPRATP